MFLQSKNQTRVCMRTSTQRRQTDRQTDRQANKQTNKQTSKLQLSRRQQQSSADTRRAWQAAKRIHQAVIATSLQSVIDLLHVENIPCHENMWNSLSDQEALESNTHVKQIHLLLLCIILYRPSSIAQTVHSARLVFHTESYLAGSRQDIKYKSYRLTGPGLSSS